MTVQFVKVLQWSKTHAFFVSEIYKNNRNNQNCTLKQLQTLSIVAKKKTLKYRHTYRLHRFLVFRLSGLQCNQCFSSLFGWSSSCELHLNKVTCVCWIYSRRSEWKAPSQQRSRSPTPPAFDALGDAASAVLEVVLVASTAAVGEHSAPLGDRVVGEPPLCTVTCPRVHGNGARVCGLHVWTKTQKKSGSAASSVLRSSQGFK